MLKPILKHTFTFYNNTQHFKAMYASQHNNLPVTDKIPYVDVATEPLMLVTIHLYMEDLVTLCKTNEAEVASLR